MKQWWVIKFQNAENIMLPEIYWNLKNVYVDMTLNVSTVWRLLCVSDHGRELKDTPWKWHKISEKSSVNILFLTKEEFPGKVIVLK